MSQSTRNLVFAVTALVTISLGALPCRAVVADAIMNGDFEVGGTPTTPPTDWDYGNDGVVGISTDTPDGSAQSMLVLNDGTDFYQGQARQDTPLDPQAWSVQLSFSYKGDNPRWALYTDAWDQMGADHPSDYVPGRDHGVWTDYSTNWMVVPAGTPAVHMLLYDIDHRNTEATLFDNVRLIALIPEPGSVLLLGAAMLGLAGARRRGRQG